jgi:hypothetical protein
MSHGIQPPTAAGSNAMNAVERNHRGIGGNLLGIAYLTGTPK